MTQLTKGMFGTVGKPKVGLFGLETGQVGRIGEVVAEKSGWYNTRGERLGSGDLTAIDMLRISTEIEPNELFIVLDEHDSFWKFTTDTKERRDVSVPGPEYVVEHALYVIGYLSLFKIEKTNKMTVAHPAGLWFTVVKREHLKEWCVK